MKQFINCALLIMCISLPAQNIRETIKKIDSFGLDASGNFSQSNYREAYNYYSNALLHLDTINDNYSVAVATLNLGKIYHVSKAYKQAQSHYFKSLTISKQLQDCFLLANTYLDLGQFAIKTHDYDNAITYLETALVYAGKTAVNSTYKNTSSKSTTYKASINLALAHIKKAQFKKAEKHLISAKTNLDQLPYNPFFVAQYNFVSGFYLEQQQAYNDAIQNYNKAVGVLEQATSNALALQILRSKVYQSLSQSYLQIGRHEKAYSYLLNHTKAQQNYQHKEQLIRDEIWKSQNYQKDYISVINNTPTKGKAKGSSSIKIFSFITVLSTIVLMVLTLSLYKNYKANLKLSKILKLRNVELERSKKEAEASSQLKTQFISNVTHELRTPLYGVVGLSSLLLNSSDLSKKEFKYVKSIKYSADYLLQLVNDVLQMGKMEAGSIMLKNTPSNLRKMLKDIVATFENRLQETNNTLKTEIDESIPKMLDFDKVKLTQILVNLIGNSIKFTQDGNIYLRVKQLNTTKNKVHLKFEIEDSGSGISKNDQNKIFKNFIQLGDKNNNKYQGTGLGLPIAQNLVALFGGSITLKSTLKKGSTFSFSIALDKCVVKAHHTSVINQSIKDLEPNANYKVLVAEDNKINQIVTRNLLETQNFECHVVNNGAEAIEEFKKHTFDIILMDINMPVMGGIEAAKKIRKINPNIPIIALTAADIEEVEKDYKSIGYNDVITKPFDNCTFFQKIVERIQESRRQESAGLSKQSRPTLKTTTKVASN